MKRQAEQTPLETRRAHQRGEVEERFGEKIASLEGTEAGLALLLQPTLSFVWDVLFFARPMTLPELIGAAIAIAAIDLGSRKRSQQVQGARQ